MYEVGVFKDELPLGPFWIFIQIFFSGPVLLGVAIILLYKGKSMTLKIAGVFLGVTSIYWMYRIVDELANKA